MGRVERTHNLENKLSKISHVIDSFVWKYQDVLETKTDFWSDVHQKLYKTYRTYISIILKINSKNI